MNRKSRTAMPKTTAEFPVNVGTRVPERVATKIHEAARREGRSVSNYLRVLISRAVGEMPEPEPETATA